MSTGLARNWWAVGLRGMATIIFGLVAILLLTSSTTASFIMLFAVYVAADGRFTILTAILAVQGEAKRWWTLMLEGLTDLVLAGWVLVWPAIAVAPFLHASSIWAIVSGVYARGSASAQSIPWSSGSCPRRWHLDGLGHSVSHDRARRRG